MKRKQIDVVTQQDKPFKILLNGSWCQVTEILDCWEDTGQWWKGESEKAFWRMHLEQEQVMEIYQDLSTLEWWLYKVYD